MTTDEPGYPGIARRWIGSDGRGVMPRGACLPQPHDAAPPVAGPKGSRYDTSRHPRGNHGNGCLRQGRPGIPRSQ